MFRITGGVQIKMHKITRYSISISTLNELNPRRRVYMYVEIPKPPKNGMICQLTMVLD
jgi:hypothetical protein